MLLLQVLYHKSWNSVESDVKHNKTKQYKTKQTKPEDIKTVVSFIKHSVEQTCIDIIKCNEYL
jgi:hypothetical protein